MSVINFANFRTIRFYARPTGKQCRSLKIYEEQLSASTAMQFLDNDCARFLSFTSASSAPVRSTQEALSERTLKTGEPDDPGSV